MKKHTCGGSGGSAHMWSHFLLNESLNETFPRFSGFRGGDKVKKWGLGKQITRQCVGVRKNIFSFFSSSPSRGSLGRGAEGDWPRPHVQTPRGKAPDGLGRERSKRATGRRSQGWTATSFRGCSALTCHHLCCAEGGFPLCGLLGASFVNCLWSGLKHDY